MKVKLLLSCALLSSIVGVYGSSDATSSAREFSHRSNKGVLTSEVMHSTFSENAGFQEIALTGNVIDKKDFEVLSALLGQQRQLRTLKFERAQFRPSEILILLRGISTCPLQKLSFNFTSLDVGSAEALARYLPALSSSLTELYLSGCKIGDAGIQALAQTCHVSQIERGIFCYCFANTLINIK